MLSNSQSNLVRVLPVIFMLTLFGCDKFVVVDPPAVSVSGPTVYSGNTSAAAAMTSIYDNMIASPGLSSGTVSISFLQGLAADELTSYPGDPTSAQFYANALININVPYWAEIYNEIHVANAVMEGLENSSGVTDKIKQQLLGEAKFMRAFLTFYAVNLFGDVPLVTSTNYQVNNTIKRTPVADIYRQIIADLKDAQTRLSDDFLDPFGNTTTERVRPNKGAATALLARAYLYAGKWDSAETQATMLINNASVYALDTLNGVFLANSTEAIWQFQPVYPDVNTFDAMFFILTAPPGSGWGNVAMSARLHDAFEAGDERFANWIGSYTDAGSGTIYYYPNKYKIFDPYDPTIPVTEYTMVLRLGEQYLIRAEARAQLGDVAGAQSDLNVIRTRAGLPNTSAGDQAALLSAVLHERQVELFTEWGHRWFDLLRTNSVDTVMGSPGNVCQAKGGTWSPNWKLMPIPLSDIQANPNLTQNEGY